MRQWKEAELGEIKNKEELFRQRKLAMNDKSGKIRILCLCKKQKQEK